MKPEKIAVVTGSNRGIGFATVKGMCERFSGKVYLTARNVEQGENALKELNALGFHPEFHQLDVKDQESIDRFKNHIVTTHGGIDILINNAGVSSQTRVKESFGAHADEIVAVNYFALLRVCEALFPILRENGRVVNVTSSYGHLSAIPSKELQEKLGNSFLTIRGLNDLMQKFVNDAYAGKHEEEGWGSHAYTVSKVGCSALTFIQQREFDKEIPSRNISVNCVHPGYVATSMTFFKGDRTIEEGAIASLYVALDDHQLKGQYVWCDKTIVDWYASDVPVYQYMR